MTRMTPGEILVGVLAANGGTNLFRIIGSSVGW